MIVGRPSSVFGRMPTIDMRNLRGGQDSPPTEIRQRYHILSEQETWPRSTRSIVIISVISILGILLLLALVGLMAVILMHSTGARPNESIPTYFSRIMSGGPKQCDSDPPVYQYLHWDWDGVSLDIGTVVRYQCGYVNETPIAKALQCRQPGRWEETYDNPRACRLDEAGYKSKEDAERRLNIPSCAVQDPPKAGNYYRDWNRLKWDVGTKINYYCSKHKDSPLVKTVICNAELSWEVVHQTDDTCECEGKPEGISESDELLVWDEDTRWIGTIIGYRCTDSLDSEYAKMFECNNDKVWELISRNECPSTW